MSENHGQPGRCAAVHVGARRWSGSRPCRGLQKHPTKTNKPTSSPTPYYHTQPPREEATSEQPIHNNEWQPRAVELRGPTRLPVTPGRCQANSRARSPSVLPSVMCSNSVSCAHLCWTVWRRILETGQPHAHSRRVEFTTPARRNGLVVRPAVVAAAAPIVIASPGPPAPRRRGGCLAGRPVVPVVEIMPIYDLAPIDMSVGKLCTQRLRRGGRWRHHCLAAGYRWCAYVGSLETSSTIRRATTRKQGWSMGLARRRSRRWRPR